MTNPGVPPGPPKGPEGDSDKKKWGYKREQFDAVITKTRFNGAFERLASGEIDVASLLRVLDDLNGASHQGRYMAEMLALKKESRRIVTLPFSPAVARFLIDSSRRIPMLSDGLASQLAVTLACAADNAEYLDTVNSAVANLLLDLDHPLKADTRNYLRALTDKIDATRKLQKARAHLSTVPSVYPPPSSEAEPRIPASAPQSAPSSFAETPSPIIELTAPKIEGPVLEDPRSWTKTTAAEDEVTALRSVAPAPIVLPPERDAPSIVAIVAQHAGVSRDDASVNEPVAEASSEIASAITPSAAPTELRPIDVAKVGARGTSARTSPGIGSATADLQPPNRTVPLLTPPTLTEPLRVREAAPEEQSEDQPIRIPTSTLPWRGLLIGLGLLVVAGVAAYAFLIPKPNGLGPAADTANAVTSASAGSTLRSPPDPQRGTELGVTSPPNTALPSNSGVTTVASGAPAPTPQGPSAGAQPEPSDPRTRPTAGSAPVEPRAPDPQPTITNSPPSSPPPAAAAATDPPPSPTAPPEKTPTSPERTSGGSKGPAAANVPVDSPRTPRPATDIDRILADLRQVSFDAASIEAEAHEVSRIIARSVKTEATRILSRLTPEELLFGLEARDTRELEPLRRVVALLLKKVAIDKDDGRAALAIEMLGEWAKSRKHGGAAKLTLDQLAEEAVILARPRRRLALDRVQRVLGTETGTP
jgi:hypothetical protein